MPIYEFICESCGNNFDKICPVNFKPEDIVCPACGKNETKRKLSTFSFGSRTSSGGFKAASAGGGGCSSCSSHNCSSCK